MTFSTSGQVQKYLIQGFVVAFFMPIIVSFIFGAVEYSVGHSRKTVILQMAQFYLINKKNSHLEF